MLTKLEKSTQELLDQSTARKTTKTRLTHMDIKKKLAKYTEIANNNRNTFNKSREKSQSRGNSLMISLTKKEESFSQKVKK